MRKTIIAAMLLIACGITQAFNPPTMGWSSWNTFGLNISEKVILGQAEAMVKTGLDKAGFKYINIDDGYFLPHDENGVLGVRQDRFPNGMRYVADEIHKLGLKAGIYSDAGANACGGSRNIGYYGHEVEDNILFFDTWDYDFVKVDYCGGSQLKLDEEAQYTKIVNAIRNNVKKKDVTFNICRWAYPGTWVSGVADSWRTTGDIYCAWESVRSIIKENLYLSAFTGGGHYNDMDMLETGRTLKPNEEITHFGVWCILSSPLLIGCDMTQIPEFSLNLMKNPEIIAFNQDKLGISAPVVQREGEVYVFAKDMEKIRGSKRAICVTNLEDEDKTIEVDVTALGYDGAISLRDVVKREEFASNVSDKFSVTVPAHGSQLLLAKGSKRNEPVLYEAEAAWLKGYQELRPTNTAAFGNYEKASGGVAVINIGNMKDNYLEWKNVFSKKGGKYELTFAYVSGENRSFDVFVNGEKVTTFANVNSGSWDKLGKCTIEVKLKKGFNSIKLDNEIAAAPNIDCMTMKKL